MIITDSTLLKLKFKNDKVVDLGKENESMDLLVKKFGKQAFNDDVLKFLNKNENEIIRQLKNTKSSNGSKTIELYKIYEPHEFTDYTEFLGNSQFQDLMEEVNEYDTEVVNKVFSDIYEENFKGSIPTYDDFMDYVVQNKESILRKLKDSINN